LLISVILLIAVNERCVFADPRRAQLASEFEERKARIQQLVKDIDEASEPELKKELKEQLRQIHVERYRRFQAIAQSSRPNSDDKQA